MLRRTTVVVAALAVLAIGLASATSLGVFTAPVSSGHVEDVNPCTYETATPLDGLVNLLLTALPTSEITDIELTGVSGDCEGLTPIAVVEGQNLVTGDTEVLFVIDQFSPLGAGDTGTVNLSLTSHIALGNLGLLVYVPTNVRIGFCPGGATCM